MIKNPLIDWVVRKLRLRTLAIICPTDGSVIIRQGWRRVRLSQQDYLRLLMLKEQQP